MNKRFALDAADIRALAEGYGSCIASDQIMVTGQLVDFMYREPPDDDTDSGWRFLSGEETAEYTDDPANFGLYDVNTVANYDPDIIQHLSAPAFSAFERHHETGQLVAVEFPG